jgi:hypothetical protein
LNFRREGVAVKVIVHVGIIPQKRREVKRKVGEIYQSQPKSFSHSNCSS